MPFLIVRGKERAKARAKASLCVKSTFLSKAPKARKARRARGKEKGITKATEREKAPVIHNLFIAIDVSRHIMA